ncbi:hypothetical protein P171DRAFT_475754 [Karstenula rhodostoma CBS 690.94]|uniref:Uncharacterized protein n=1 Tax=Karstenula rhodostoma CBS 690.94 TaxID=1392251 RepID=A0A9P4U7V3_9PLEO|nr:hypothetical protein P171DRAFT_475754 [Karstenula rhodostoma CBS 690.94]
MNGYGLIVFLKSPSHTRTTEASLKSVFSTLRGSAMFYASRTSAAATLMAPLPGAELTFAPSVILMVKDPAFGTAMILTVTPIDQDISINYKIVIPGSLRTQYSPNTTPVQEQAKGLVDLAKLTIDGDNTEPTDKLAQWAAGVRDRYPLWSKNVVSHLRMGDFRDKRIHNGTNLTGGHTLLASEFVPLSNYRVTLVTSGKIFDPAMTGGAHETNIQTPLLIDSKPGNYSPSLLAYGHNIVLTKLGMDKVHNDYGGVPMKIAPGSRMENGVTPVVDSTNLNRSLALVSAFFYAPEAVHLVLRTTPKILAFGGQKKFKAVLPERI